MNSLNALTPAQVRAKINEEFLEKARWNDRLAEKFEAAGQVANAAQHRKWAAHQRRQMYQ